MKSQKGITLIALVITIIVMLILVGVTITMAVNGGLFDKASDAVTQTNGAMTNEAILSNGLVAVNGILENQASDINAIVGGYVNGTH